MEFLEFKELYNELSNRYIQISKYLDMDIINERLKKLKDMTLKENFWANKNEASTVLKSISRIEYDLEFYDKIHTKFEDLKLCVELSEINESIDIESKDSILKCY